MFDEEIFQYFCINQNHLSPHEVMTRDFHFSEPKRVRVISYRRIKKSGNKWKNMRKG